MKEESEDKAQEIIEQLSVLANSYCESVLPTEVYLGFKKPIDKVLIIKTKYPIPDKDILVVITDIYRDWQAPYAGTKEIGNPKLKTLTKDEFEKTFDIISYSVGEKSRFIMSVLSQLNIDTVNDFLHNGKPKQIHHYQ